MAYGSWYDAFGMIWMGGNNVSRSVSTEGRAFVTCLDNVLSSSIVISEYSWQPMTL